MPLYKFTSTMTIEADSREEAEEQFADESLDFAANADVQEVEETNLSLKESAEEYASIISKDRDTPVLRRHRRETFKEGANWMKNKLE